MLRRLTALTQAGSVVAFVSAAAAMLAAGALHAAGQVPLSAVAATSGYALGLAGIALGVLALVVDRDPEASGQPTEFTPLTASPQES